MLKSLKYILPIVAVMLECMLTFSCAKDDSYLDDTSAKLEFSCDTVAFDTVFTTMGSVTKKLLVYNNYDDPILLNKVTLKNDYRSRFRINVDGDTSMEVRNLVLPAHDSIFLFVQANINPNSSNEPFLIEDAVEFDYCGKVQSLPLTAYGRNAIYHTPTDTIWTSDHQPYLYYSVVDCEHWDHTKPHVILDYAVVDDGSTLRLTAGDELYFGNDACLWIYDGGTLKVSGTKDQPVMFTSVRHDGWYDSLPGQWNYIWCSSGSIDNEIDYAVIENSYIGVLVDTNVNSNPTLTITNTILSNISNSAIYGQGSYIVGDNLLATCCGDAVLALQVGGRYKFSNSTFANFWDFGSTGHSNNYHYTLSISNYYTYTSNGSERVEVRNIEQAYFYNCIFDGAYSLGSGGVVQMAQHADGAFNVLFDHCLIKSNEAMAYAENSQLCEDPKFANRYINDYHLLEDSPAVAAGSYSWVSIPHDLDGVSRGIPPCIGAYELK